MSSAKSQKPGQPTKASYRLSKARRAAIKHAKALGRLDPFAESAGHARKGQREQAAES